MRRTTTGAVLAVSWGLTLLWAASAGAVVIDDQYHGAKPTRGSYGDVVAARSDRRFDVHGARIEQSGHTLMIDILTNFAGNSGIFSNLTKDGKGITYGDLFLSENWDPVGDAQDHYINDNHANGTHWSYGFALDNRWSGSGGQGTLYSLGGTGYSDNILLTDDVMRSGIYRSGQEFAVDIERLGNAGVVGEGSWTVLADALHFEIDIGKTGDIGLRNGVALHWGMSCGNDVIEGFAIEGPPDRLDSGQVPAPATALLMMLGIAGLGSIRARASVPSR